MTRLTEDEAREYRIAMEAVIDAYNEIERAMGWYYYLEGKLIFPFKARCRVKRAISPLKVGDLVELLSMAPEDECESEMFVMLRHRGDSLAVPLSQLEPLSKDRDTVEAIGDWHYWIARGYQF